ncbi:glycoside hydrolase [Massariosphaeria phaeospora]|uniref:lytic cellulose monooxygenase (C4-dehydrogenating) n=1 Tax=Massariosphaeria phaeospora TaxID=100035 RepID=A0A7C8I245_9PLEO|nr:glycoside hydrolase [Massariosphaeria phaeospora]
MKAIFVAGLLAQLTSAHYIFGHLWVNGTRSDKWQYVRDVAPNPMSADPARADDAKTYPNKDIKSPQTTCGLNAFKSAKSTQTATVLAGAEVGFEPVEVWAGGTEIYHWGPASAWLSRAPGDDVEGYEGLGDWFKVAYMGPSDNVTWSTLNKKGPYNFTIPKTTPPGKYLLRFEHLRPYSIQNVVEVYANCAHVNIVGPGGGTPSKFARFPGTYDWNDPGILIKPEWDYNLYIPGVERGGLLNYPPPGPPVWTG